MRFRLRYLHHDLELSEGQFAVGRSAGCQLSLDDPLVSRRHAVLRVRKDGVSVQDLGSRNGVLVNGGKIAGERELAGGDKVSIGSQEMVLTLVAEANPASNREDVYRRATQTLGAAYVSDLRGVLKEAQAAAAAGGAAAAAGGPLTPRQKPPTPNPGVVPVADPPTTDASRSVQSFHLLGGVADKALAMGKADEAERILQALLTDVVTRSRDGATIEPGVTEPAARYAARLAGATGKASWVDFSFEVYRLQRRMLPAAVIDELLSVVRKVKNLELGAVRAYLDVLRELAPTFGPAERFLLQRVESLERQMALR